MPEISISINILGHIAADSELEGRFGVQGNTLFNTVAYLAQYLEKHQFATQSSQLLTLVARVKALHQSIKDVNQLNQSTANLDRVKQFARNKAGDILDLPADGELMLPGGWSSQKVGHAMIYHFKRDHARVLRLFIYNAGGGIEYHQKKTGRSSEQAYAAKIYEFPANINLEHLVNLITELTVPRVLHLHTRAMDAEQLYQKSIEEAMAFLIDLTTTQPTLASDLFDDVLTTSGQISGTCSQRSIHQMLKHYFAPSLKTYRRFILDFKIEAIQDYLKTHPGSMHSDVKDLVNQAIINTRKIAYIDDVFEDDSERDIRLHALTKAQEQLFKRIVVPSPTITRKYSPLNFRLNSMGRAHGIPRLTVARIPQCNSKPDVRLNVRDDLNAQLLSFVGSFNVEKLDYPLWVARQIEQLMLDMPLPALRTQMPGSSSLEIYAPLIEKRQNYLTFEHYFKELQSIYDAACERAFGKQHRLSTQVLTRVNMMVIRNYVSFHQKHEVDHSPYTSKLIECFCQVFKHNPFFATHDRRFDSRFITIQQLFDNKENREPIKPQRFFEQYKKLIDFHLELKEMLATKYRLNPPADLGFQALLKDYHCTELFVLFDQYGPFAELKPDSFLNTEPLWFPLRDAMTHQIELERAVVQAFNPIFDSPCSITQGFSLAAKDGFLTFTVPLFLDRLDKKVSKLLNCSQYTSLASEVEHALYYGSYGDNLFIEAYKDEHFNRPTENEIQLTPASGRMESRLVGPSDFFYRDLFHLRTVPHFQINLTLSYFHTNLYRLAEESIQRYVEANVFESGRLIETVEKHPDFFLRFDRFIDDGIKRFRAADETLTPAGLFFVRLSTQVAQYFSETHPARLDRALHQLNAWLAVNNDPLILASLHRLRFLALISHSQEGRLLTDEQWLDALTSYFYVQTKEGSKVSMEAASQHRFKVAQHAFFQIMETRLPNLSEEDLLRLIRRIEPTFKDFQLQKIDLHSWRLYHPDDASLAYTIHPMTGTVYFNERRLAPIPLELHGSLLLSRLGLVNESSCWISMDNTIIEFDARPRRVMLQRVADASWNVWKKLSALDPWLELIPLSVQQKTALKLAFEPERIDLPEIFRDADYDLWQSCTDGSLSLMEQDRLVLRQGAASTMGGRQVVNAKDEQVISPHDLSTITAFEDPKFIMAVKQKSKTIGVSLTRYGIELTERKAGGPMYLVSMPHLILRDSAAFSPFSSSIACLNFSDEKHENRSCIVPVKPFYVIPDEHQPVQPGALYHLTHDTSDVVATYRVKTFLRKEERPENTWPLWRYRQTERYIQYSLDEYNQPIAEKAADGLYLCYLFLASGGVERAWDLLARLPSLQGTNEEIEFIEWIVNGLPVILGEDETDTQAKLRMPKYQACQLKAMSLLTDYLGQGKSLQLNEPTYDFSFANGYDEKLRFERLQAFYKTLPKTIYQFYHAYLVGHRHLDATFYLDGSTQKSLLEYYAGQTRGVIGGTISYQQRALTLSTLAREIRWLEAYAEKIKTHGSEPKGFIPLTVDAIDARIQEINTEVANQCAVMGISTKIEQVNLNLGIPDCVRGVNEAKLTVKAKSSFDQWFKAVIPSDVSKSMALLTPDVTQDNFFEHFPVYWSIAKNKAHPSHQALREFCIKYLIGHRHITLDKQTNDIPLLVNVLYRLCDRGSSEITLNFSQLLQALRTIEPTPIAIYQTKNVFSDLLVDAVTLFSEVSATLPIIEPSMPEPDPVLMPELSSDLASLLSSGSHLFFDFCLAFRQEEKGYVDALDGIRSRLPESLTMDALHTAEHEAGQLLFHHVKEEKRLASQLTDDVLQDIKTGMNALHSRWDSQLIQSRQIMLDLGQTLPDDPVEKRRIQRERDTLKRRPLTEKELLNLYFNGQESAYREATGFTSEAIKALHQATHTFVQTKLYWQQIQRILKALNDLSRPATLAERHALSLLIMSMNHPDARRNPMYMRFQLEANVLLRPDQIQALSHLLSTPELNPYEFDNVIEKLTMGGGKSKVLLPLMAQAKATGLNLVVIEVPRSLLETNYEDLNATSQALFNQKAVRFEFDRDTDFSSERLEALYGQLLDTMVRRDYLVTTSESVQSFVLKYLELLYSPPSGALDSEAYKTWDAQVKQAAKIVRFFKERADVVMDEVHDNLLLKKKINYTLGATTPVSEDVILHGVNLFRFLAELNPKKQGRHKVEGEHGWASLVDQLPSLLIFEPNSPLASLVSELTNDKHEKQRALLDYLAGNASCPFLEECKNKSIQDTFAFYKEQCALLPRTLNRRYGENYGPSQREHLSEIKRMLAIPYIANGKPNERALFGKVLETINYSAQSLFIDGISLTMLKELIEQWLAQARNELFQHPELRYLEETRVAQGIKKLYLGEMEFDFSQLDHLSDAQFSLFYERHRYNHHLILEVLGQQVLPQIREEGRILHSNAFNHIDIYRSAQGISGTPNNFTTYHRKLRFNPKVALGADGYIQTVLKEKATKIQAIEFKEKATFIHRLFTETPEAEKINAIMDISATFAGLPNLEVAQSLVDYFHEQRSEIRYVLYFDKLDRLCALACDSKDVIVINSSDPKIIERKLNQCPPEKRFTYYDQAHTVGTDILQSGQSYGLALVDERTSMQAFLQGAMRMRDLVKGDQKITIVTPKSIGYDDLMSTMERIEVEQLASDNFVGALDNIDNVIRNDCLMRISTCSDAKRQSELAMAFERYFIEQQSTDLVARYGAILTKQRAKDVLEAYAQAAIRQWSEVLRSTHYSPTEKEARDLEAKVDEIVVKTAPLCAEFVNWSPVASRGYGREIELEQEKQKERYSEHELNHQSQYYSPQFLPEPISDVITYTGLNDVFGHDQAIFSSALMVSNRFMRTYQGQTMMIGPFLKPSFIVCFEKAVTGKLTAKIITTQEAKKIEDNRSFDGWLVDTRHTVLGGRPPEGFLENAEYLTLMEQVQFFAGDLRLLAQQDRPLIWLNKEPEKKLKVFQSSLLPCRTTTAADFAMLSAIYSSVLKGFDDINQRPFTDMRRTDWKRKYPDLSQQGIQSLTTMAQAFYVVNQAPMTEYFENIDSYLTRFSLHPAAVGHFLKHIELLKIVRLLHWVSNSDKAPPPALLRAVELNSYSELRAKYRNNTAQIQLAILIACVQSKAYSPMIGSMPELKNYPFLKGLSQESISPEAIVLHGISQAKDLETLMMLCRLPQTTATLKHLFSCEILYTKNNIHLYVQDLLEHASVTDLPTILTTIKMTGRNDDLDRVDTKINLMLNVLKTFKRSKDTTIIESFVSDLRNISLKTQHSLCRDSAFSVLGALLNNQLLLSWNVPEAARCIFNNPLLEMHEKFECLRLLSEKSPALMKDVQVSIDKHVQAMDVNLLPHYWPFFISNPLLLNQSLQQFLIKHQVSADKIQELLAKVSGMSANSLDALTIWRWLSQNKSLDLSKKITIMTSESRPWLNGLSFLKDLVLKNALSEEQLSQFIASDGFKAPELQEYLQSQRNKLNDEPQPSPEPKSGPTFFREPPGDQPPKKPIPNEPTPGSSSSSGELPPRPPLSKSSEPKEVSIDDLIKIYRNYHVLNHKDQEALTAFYNTMQDTLSKYLDFKKAKKDGVLLHSMVGSLLRQIKQVKPGGNLESLKQLSQVLFHSTGVLIPYNRMGSWGKQGYCNNASEMMRLSSKLSGHASKSWQRLGVALCIVGIVALVGFVVTLAVPSVTHDFALLLLHAGLQHSQTLISSVGAAGGGASAILGVGLYSSNSAKGLSKQVSNIAKRAKDFPLKSK